ncbi:uncharacterized protein LOC108892871 isoform X3 [Lates calcarifer]|uniref:Uncharacterized protein LOC108892871 isoform X3 n=1 Tax=Lates calcarifer TaxID=8187 RepID=A0AAJ8AWH6_LATCA|nr:uncharacterized protein LOC108892871 isoform X3 [Lates calcarifer]
MGGWTLFFVLLLPLTVCFGDRVTLVKTLGSKPDVTPVCTNNTKQGNDTDIITLLVCRIRTERSRGEECRLLYQHGQDFEYECDSRFRLMTENQTVFLHLTNLTAEDSGNYNCQCAYPGGTLILHLNVTVEEEEAVAGSTESLIPCVLIGVAIVIIITGVILGFIYRGIHHGRQQEPLSSRPGQETQDVEPYSTFIRRESGLYSTVKIHGSNINTNNSNMFMSDTDTGSGKFHFTLYPSPHACVTI